MSAHALAPARTSWKDRLKSLNAQQCLLFFGLNPLRLLYLLPLLQVEIVLYSQHGFKHPLLFGHEAGLDGGMINSITQDTRGYFWLATTGGLYRFDGSGAVAFKHDPGDSLSLPDNHLTGIFFDSTTHGLWLSTQMNGICRFDIYTGKCRWFPYVIAGEKKITPTMSS